MVNHNIKNIEELILNYLKNDEFVNKLMTKSIYLSNDLIDTYVKNNNEDLFKAYLESITSYKYFDICDYHKHHFIDLKQYHINYEHFIHNKNLTNNINYVYPNPKDITLSHHIYSEKFSSYPLNVIMGEYYRITKPLNDYSLNLVLKVNDLELNSKQGKLYFSINLDDKTKNIIKGVDSRLEYLFENLININRIDKKKCKFLKKIQDNKKISFELLYDKKNSLYKKIKIEQVRKETSNN